MKKLVSFSLFGDRAMYHDGAIENAVLMPEIYPDWIMRVYHADDTDQQTVDTLKELGCETISSGISHDMSGMLWRFLPSWDDTVERAIFRDADSRINWKEQAAVEAWIESGKDAHCMHDHPHHYCLPIMGGMWGIKSGVLPNMMCQWSRYMTTMQRRVSDMRLLRDTILPHIEGSLLRHSAHVCEWEHEAFPPHKPIEGFVGQQIDENGRIWA